MPLNKAFLKLIYSSYSLCLICCWFWKNLESSLAGCSVELATIRMFVFRNAFWITCVIWKGMSSGLSRLFTMYCCMLISRGSSSVSEANRARFYVIFIGREGNTIAVWVGAEGEDSNWNHWFSIGFCNIMLVFSSISSISLAIKAINELSLEVR